MVRQLISSQQTEILEQWLAHYGFERNPFGECEAGRESRLAEYFVPTPYYDEILGSAGSPRTMLVYAPRGCGKTAHRIMVARACRPHAPNSDILTVVYTDFGALPREMARDPGAIDLRRHLDQILRAGIAVFIEVVVRDPALAVSLTPERLARLKWLCKQYHFTALGPTALMSQLRALDGDHFAPDWGDFQRAWQAGRLGELMADRPIMERPAARFLIALADAYPELVEVERLSEVQIFGRFVDLVCSVGLKAVYVLVDRVDEPGDLADDPRVAADFIAPLLADLPLMEYPCAAFKYFLPLEMRQAIESKPSVRLDRLLSRQVAWEPEALSALLKQRLIVFSGGQVEDLAALSDETLRNDIDAAIVHHAQGVPRNLLRLGDALFAAHCRQAEGRLTLGLADWKAALSEFYGTCPATRLQLPHAPLLSLDPETRMVHVGTRAVKLSDAPFMLLQYLYERPGDLVRSTDLADVAGSDDSMRKTISRIREAIEPDAERPVYLLTVRGRGYRLVNVQPRREDV
jgi:hypothetical protein